MDIHFATIKSVIVTCYMKVNGKIFEGPGFNNFIPIINEFELKSTTDIQMKHYKDVCQNIDSYDEHDSNKLLNQAVKETKKINVTNNDINVGTTDIILNFTDFNVVCYNSANIPMLLAPLDTKALKDIYRGKVILLQIHRLNNPNTVSTLTGSSGNFLKNILNKHKIRGNNNAKIEDYLKIIEFADQSWDQIGYADTDYRCNTIKVVTASIIPGDMFMENNKKACNIYLVNHDLLLTRNTMIHNNNNPGIYKDIDVSVFKNTILPGCKFLYIVDKNNAISERFYSVGNYVVPIPRVVNQQFSQDGLYVASMSESFQIDIEEFIEIGEIDKIEFVYKTKEEAQYGADKYERFNQELKDREGVLRQRELELKNIGLDKKAEYEDKLHRLKTEYEEFKNKSFRDTQEHEERFLKLKRELEAINLRDKTAYETNDYNMRNYFDERKYARDDIKYAHESGIENLKTIAATCGVIATGFVIMKQLGKI